MVVKHAHVELAEAQRVQKTLLAPGPCPHLFEGRQKNIAVYGLISKGPEFEFYDALLAMTNMKDPLSRRLMAGIMAAAEIYTKRMIQIWVELCNLRTFKDQDGVYQKWGPAGDFMMMRIMDYVRELEKKHNIRIICQHDCKRGDLGATMIGYYDRFIGNLSSSLEIGHAFLGYDTMNIQLYMGSDVLMLKEVQKKNYIPAHGLKLMREKGKGIIVVDKTSNDSGPEYQQLFIPKRGRTLEECVAEDINSLAEYYGLVYDELSPLGLVVGSTHQANGMLRLLFPTGTWWVPGYGNQGGKFENIMLELIREGKWCGQGATFTNETGMMYVWMENQGGTGKIHDAEMLSISATKKFQEAEYKAYQTPEVKAAGIRYPF